MEKEKVLVKWAGTCAALCQKLTAEGKKEVISGT
jgi:hypothetical protein